MRIQPPKKRGGGILAAHPKRLSKSPQPQPHPHPHPFRQESIKRSPPHLSQESNLPLPTTPPPPIVDFKNHTQRTFPRSYIPSRNSTTALSKTPHVGRRTRPPGPGTTLRSTATRQFQRRRRTQDQPSAPPPPPLPLLSAMDGGAEGGGGVGENLGHGERGDGAEGEVEDGFGCRGQGRGWRRRWGWGLRRKKWGRRGCWGMMG